MSTMAAVVIASAQPVEGAAAPAGLRTLATLARDRGWRIGVTRSLAITPPEFYAASNKTGMAGRVRKPAAQVEVYALRVRRGSVVGYGTWWSGRWTGGAALDPHARRFATCRQFEQWIKGEV